VTSAELQERFADVVAVLTASAPDQGWLSLGSWRGRIWIETTETFLGHGPWTALTGLGLGEHIGLHKDLGPHSEILSLWFQAGVLAPLLWLALVLGAALAVGQLPRHPVRDHAIALGVAVALTAPLSNDVLTRQTLVWWTFAVLGAASARPQASEEKVAR